MRTHAAAIAIGILVTGAFNLVAPVSASASGRAVIKVPRDFATIQAAVDAAPPGATIHVAPGTYTEQIVITKDLDLRGAGAGATTIASPSTLAPFAVNTRINSAITAIVRVGQGAHVRMSGLTVSGPIPCVPVSGVAVVQTAALDLTDARVSGITHDPNCPLQTARALVFGLPPYFVVQGVPGGATAYGLVSNVIVDNYQDVALQAVGPPGVAPTSVAFTDNVIVSGSPAVPTEQLSIFIIGNVRARVTGNSISGGVCDIPGCGPDPINDFQAMGVFAAPSGPGTAISDNRVSGTDVGISQFASPKCCRISDNTLTDNRFFGIVIQDGDGATDSNTITGGQTGIGIVADAVDTTGVLRGDVITGTSLAPIRELDCCGYTATAIVTN